MVDKDTEALINRVLFEVNDYCDQPITAQKAIKTIPTTTKAPESAYAQSQRSVAQSARRSQTVMEKRSLSKAEMREQMEAIR